MYERTPDISDVLERFDEGSEVVIRGWIHRVFKVGGKVFAWVRDHSGFIQVVFDKSGLSTEWESVERLSRESSVEVRGSVRVDERAPGGKEVIATELVVYGYSPPFPIKGGEDVEYLLNVRHLWLRSRQMIALLKIKHTVIQALKDWLLKDGWWETTPPILTGSAVEGGATLFEVKYFDKIAYLSQSAQLYLEVLIFPLNKVWALTPSFRAEKSRTRRHLSEYWHLEVEAAWYDMDDMMGVAEGLVSHAVAKTIEERKDELKLLNRDISKLESALHPPYPKVTYDEALEILARKGFNIGWGEDYGADEEKALTEEFDKPFFVTHFPKRIKAFYMKEDPKRPEVVLGFDLLAPEGYGEVIGGSQREDDYEKLYNRVLMEGLDFKDYEWYLDLRKYGSVPHSGFGLGIERLVMWIAGIEHIRDAVPFPRWRERIYP
ncbi:MAG: asparagine--tRNA ligase [Zestosphaera sp.]